VLGGPLGSSAARSLTGRRTEAADYDPYMEGPRNGWSGSFVVPPPANEPERAPAPTFSILIPAYQAQDTVADAVESALNQTTPAHEIIVCDDGSTDRTVAALTGYLDRVMLVQKENGGGASALNAAARTASGEFVAILDADDVYRPQRIEALTELARARPDLDVLVTDAYFIERGHTTGRFYASNRFEVADQRGAILRSCFVGGWPAVRRRRLLELGGFDESLAIGYDWDCWIRLILDGASAGLVDVPLLEYRVSPGSLTSSRVRNLESRLAVLQKTAEHPGLTAREQRILSDSLGLHARRAWLARTRSEIAPGDTRAVRLALAAAVRDRKLPITFRLKAAIGYLWPAGGVARLLDR
jgi:hypothetical protein